ncbi:MAG: hypothetical protein WB586_07100 [Chthoniobacterales bacterium]
MQRSISAPLGNTASVANFPKPRFALRLDVDPCCIALSARRSTSSTAAGSMVVAVIIGFVRSTMAQGPNGVWATPQVGLRQ